ncbi:MAG TPA: hypothetical protein VL426_07435 [Candidatus Binatia bacterium]|jgi:hypothetical protein|nr:hypothetical protein [Candidatus Binatia bacterium]
MPRVPVPDWHAMIDAAAKRQYVLVGELRKDDELVIVTESHRYKFRLLDPEHRRVEMTSDDPVHPGPVEGCLQGSKLSPWGSSIFAGRVAIGLCAVFSSASFLPRLIPPEIDLPPTASVVLNGFPLLPVAPTGFAQ